MSNWYARQFKDKAIKHVHVDSVVLKLKILREGIRWLCCAAGINLPPWFGFTYPLRGGAHCKSIRSCPGGITFYPDKTYLDVSGLFQNDNAPIYRA